MIDKNYELSIEISYGNEKITKSINEIETLDINIIENFENIFKIS